MSQRLHLSPSTTTNHNWTNLCQTAHISNGKLKRKNRLCSCCVTWLSQCGKSVNLFSLRSSTCAVSVFYFYCYFNCSLDDHHYWLHANCKCKCSINWFVSHLSLCRDIRHELTLQKIWPRFRTIGKKCKMCRKKKFRNSLIALKFKLIAPHKAQRILGAH